MLAFLAEPRTLDEMVEHRFVYRPHVEMSIVDQVERRTAELHVARMLDQGEAVEVDPSRYRVALRRRLQDSKRARIAGLVTNTGRSCSSKRRPARAAIDVERLAGDVASEIRADRRTFAMSVGVPADPG